MEAHYRAIRRPGLPGRERRRSRFSWLLALIMLVTYFGFILIIAFKPALLAMPLGPNTDHLGIPTVSASSRSVSC